MESIRVAFGEIFAHKMRSLLTMLGIVIGVSAVITVVALGTGAQRAVEAELDALGADLLSIRPNRWRGGGGFGVASSERAELRTEDADALRVSGRFLAVVPELEGNRQIEYMGRDANVDLIASTSQYLDVNRYRLVAGRMFTEAENLGRERVAVLGASVPEEVSASGLEMIGREIVVGGVGYEIVGLLAEKGSAGWNDPDDQIIIPLRTGQYRTFGSRRLRSITIQVASADSMDLAMLDIETILRREHEIRPGQPNDFEIRNQSEFLSAQQETAETFTFLLGGIAAVSLLVGGIGIMNIMLVSVTERTREIGVRKAMGATKRVILVQFLIEAIAVCAVGGLVGILVGSGVAMSLSEFQGWTTQVSGRAVIIAVAFATAVGVFFGMWPARRAARLDPIEALRYE